MRSYLVQGYGVPIECSKDSGSWLRPEYFPFQLNLTQSVGILSLDHQVLKVSKLLVNLNRTYLHTKEGYILDNNWKGSSIKTLLSFLWGRIRYW